VINILAPASNTKDAAICVTAKIRWRRLVLPVIRTPPLDRLSPLWVPEEVAGRGQARDESENHRGNDSQRCSDPKQARSTLKSSARTEKREA